MSENTEIIKQDLFFAQDIENLPDDIMISTMTITCKLNTLFNVKNIAQYVDLDDENILSVKHGKKEDITTNRTIIILKKNSKNKIKKKKRSFYNQATMQVKTSNNIINVKLFLNGSIQMTGCKSINNIREALEKVFIKLRNIKAIPDYSINKIIEKPFVEDINILSVCNLYDFQICMINSNFQIGFEINRDKLFELLLKDNIKCTYDPNIHACVNIKYNNNDKIISIFIFESGAIIITGARTCQQILSAYNFINKYLLEHYIVLNKNNSLTSSTILDYLDNLDNLDSFIAICE